MADTVVFQEHHVIEKQAFERSRLLGKLKQFGLADPEAPQNKLNLPADPGLAAKLGISPHPGGPLSSYSKRLQTELLNLEKSADGVAMMAGDKAAGRRIAEKVNSLRDTMRAGLVNGDLFTNTPLGSTPEATNAKIDGFFDEISAYKAKHADQVGNYGKGKLNAWDPVTKTEGSVKAALEAIAEEGTKAAKGPAHAAMNSLGVAIAEAQGAGRLSVSPAFAATLRTTFMKGLKGLGAVGIAADLATSTAEAKERAEKGDIAGAHSVMNGLGARLAFGWMGGEMGAAAGAGAGLYGALIGAALGGLAGLFGGEAAVKGIETVADKLAGVVGVGGPATGKRSGTPAKAPQATSHPDGSTSITVFNSENNRPSSVKTYDKNGKLIGETKTHYDPLTGVKIREESFDGAGKLTEAKTFDRQSGQLRSQTAVKPNGSGGGLGGISGKSGDSGRDRGRDSNGGSPSGGQRPGGGLGGISGKSGDSGRDKSRGGSQGGRSAGGRPGGGLGGISGKNGDSGRDKGRGGSLGGRSTGGRSGGGLGGISGKNGDSGRDRGRGGGSGTGRGGGSGRDGGRGGKKPVVLDLNGDEHIDLRMFSPVDFAAGYGPRFDWDGDGIADGTAWVGPNDGWLAIDLAADGSVGSDGVINQAKELAFTLWKTDDELAQEQADISDLGALRLVFDTNGNNQLDAGDARWSEFRVWRDTNQNGVTDAGELRTLAEADIRLIELVPSAAGARDFADGSAITGTSSYLKGNGTTALVGDVKVTTRPSSLELGTA
jgi:hypothetical protein